HLKRARKSGAIKAPDRPQHMEPLSLENPLRSVLFGKVKAPSPPAQALIPAIPPTVALNNCLCPHLKSLPSEEVFGVACPEKTPEHNPIEAATWFIRIAS